MPEIDSIEAEAAAKAITSSHRVPDPTARRAVEMTAEELAEAEAAAAEVLAERSYHR